MASKPVFIKRKFHAVCLYYHLKQDTRSSMRRFALGVQSTSVATCGLRPPSRSAWSLSISVRPYKKTIISEQTIAPSVQAPFISSLASREGNCKQPRDRVLTPSHGFCYQRAELPWINPLLSCSRVATCGRPPPFCTIYRICGMLGAARHSSTRAFVDAARPASLVIPAHMVQSKQSVCSPKASTFHGSGLQKAGVQAPSPSLTCAAQLRAAQGFGLHNSGSFLAPPSSAQDRADPVETFFVRWFRCCRLGLCSTRFTIGATLIHWVLAHLCASRSRSAGLARDPLPSLRRLLTRFARCLATNTSVAPSVQARRWAAAHVAVGRQHSLASEQPAHLGFRFVTVGSYLTAQRVRSGGSGAGGPTRPARPTAQPCWPCCSAPSAAQVATPSKGWAEGGRAKLDHPPSSQPSANVHIVDPPLRECAPEPARPDRVPLALITQPSGCAWVDQITQQFCLTQSILRKRRDASILRFSFRRLSANAALREGGRSPQVATRLSRPHPRVALCKHLTRPFGPLFAVYLLMSCSYSAPLAHVVRGCLHTAEARRVQPERVQTPRSYGPVGLRPPPCSGRRAHQGGRSPQHTCVHGPNMALVWVAHLCASTHWHSVPKEPNWCASTRPEQGGGRSPPGDTGAQHQGVCTRSGGEARCVQAPRAPRKREAFGLCSAYLNLSSGYRSKVGVSSPVRSIPQRTTPPFRMLSDLAPTTHECASTLGTPSVLPIYVIRRALYRTRNPKSATQLKSLFRFQLQETKKLSLLYGNLSIKLLQKICNQALTHPLYPDALTESVFSLLERRLDVVLFRAGFCKSLFQARQWIHHKKIYINGRILTIPGYQCNPGDIISCTHNSFHNVCKHLENFYITRTSRLADRASSPKGHGGHLRLFGFPEGRAAQEGFINGTAFGHQATWRRPVKDPRQNKAHAEGLQWLRSLYIRGCRTAPFSIRTQRMRSFAIPPLNVEVNYRNLTAVYLYSPQRIILPTFVDIYLVIRGLYRY